MEKSIFLPRLALLALSAMLSLPFLTPLHTWPIPTFYAEEVAAVLGLLAATALVGARRLPLPGAALLATACVGVALLQMATGRTPIPQLASLFVLYLLWAALLACTGSHLAQVLGKARLTRWLASGLLLGAFLSAMTNLLQPWLPALLGWSWPSPQRGGTLGQANHLTSYLWLGLASAVYLRTSATISARAFWTASAPIMMAVVLVGQRSSFLYAGALIGITLWQARIGGDANRAGYRRALGVGLLFVVLQPVAMLMPNVYDGGPTPPPAMRAASQLDGPSLRGQFWRVGVAGIMAAPLAGNGIGSYPEQALVFADAIEPADNPGQTEHAHNLFIDLGVELGIPTALMVLLAAGAWLWRLPQRAAPAEAAWAAAVMAIIGLHCMIEYPLWYAYFLGPLALVAGAFGAHREVGQRLAAIALPAGLLLWGSFALVELHRDYAQLELALALGKEPATMPQARSALLSVPQESLLSPWVDTTACVSLDPLQVDVADGLAVCRVGLAFTPSLRCESNMVALLWRSGDMAATQDLLHRLRRASQRHPEFETLLAALATRAPGLRAATESGN